MTTKFIGAWPEERLAELKEALRAVDAGGPIALDVGGFGWFDNPHHPRSLFAGIQAPAALAELHAKTDAAVAALGGQRETKPFVPHLTLARIKDRVDLAPLRRAIAELPSTQFGRSLATKHLLYKSETKESGSVYTVIGEFVL